MKYFNLSNTCVRYNNNSIILGIYRHIASIKKHLRSSVIVCLMFPDYVFYL